MEHVYGVTSVAAALMAGRRSLLRLVLADSAFKPGKSPPLMMRRLRDEAELRGIPGNVVYLPANEQQHMQDAGVHCHCTIFVRPIIP